MQADGEREDLTAGRTEVELYDLLLTALKAADRRPQAKPPQQSLQQLLQHGTVRANSSVRFSSLVALTKLASLARLFTLRVGRYYGVRCARQTTVIRCGNLEEGKG